MTVSSTTNRNEYVGDGATSSYSYTYRIFADSELTVTVRDTDDAETTLALTTDYTVSGAGDSGGGSIALVNSAQAWLDGDGDLKSNYELTIRRVLPLTQNTDIRNQGDFYPEGHEDQFDKLIMIDQQQQDAIDRTAKLPESIAASEFDPTLPTTISDATNGADRVVIVNSGATAFEMGPTASQITSANTDATAASASADEAEEWANKTTGLVEATEYSSKAYAVGGTGVTGTTGRGHSKDWATKTDGTADDAEYSSKAYAIGGTGVTTTSGKGAAKEWATKTDAAVDTSEYSAKEYAVGTQTRGTTGSAKDWATYTSAVVDASEFSAKEYAQGSQAATGGSAKNWAQETGNDITGGSAGDMSSKEWAIGTLGRGVASEGSSKDWATYTASTVDDAGYSSKEWATGTQTRGVASSGSAKDWATYTAGTVDDTEYSAKYYSQQSATYVPTVQTDTIDAGETIALGGNNKVISFIAGTGGADAMSTTPFGVTVGDFVDGQEIIMIGTDDTNYPTLADSDTQYGARLNGGISLTKGVSIYFVYSSTLERFYEISRNN